MDKQKFDKLVSESQVGNVQQRRAAVYKLGKSRDPNVVPFLIHASNDMDSSVRQNAVDGLIFIGTPEAIEFLDSKGIEVTASSKIKTSSGGLGQFLLGFAGWFIFSFMINIFAILSLFDNPYNSETTVIGVMLAVQFIGFWIAYFLFRKIKRSASWGIAVASVLYLTGFILRSYCMPPGLPFPISLFSGC